MDCADSGRDAVGFNCTDALFTYADAGVALFCAHSYVTVGATAETPALAANQATLLLARSCRHAIQLLLVFSGR